MSSSTYRVRRATVDDLTNLLALWATMNFSAVELERRLTEFQIVESADGSLLGALALEINNRHGRLHSEAFHNFALADTLRDLLWERLQSIAASHGLVRLWTSESAPFWKYNGFQSPIADILKKLPVSWTAQPADWLTLPLRDEEALQTSLTTDFTQLNAEEKQRTEKVLRRARAARNIGIGLTIIVAIGGIFFSIYLILHNPNLLHR
jgi:N-acetylglutamate synthase-like GNAT family acetyltransferase